MTWWVGEKSYNKITTGKWHGDAPPPPSAPKAKPKPTLVKSRVRAARGRRSEGARCCALRRCAVHAARLRCT